MSFQFQGQRPSEEVLLVTHQHPFVLLHPALGAVIWLLIPVGLFAFFGPSWLVSIAVCLGVLMATWKVAHAWYGWSKSLFLVTTERVVFLKQTGFFERDLVETPLPGIQQVSHAVKGIMHTFFGYGHLTLSTSSSQQPIVIPSVPDPYALQQEIVQAQHGEGFTENTEEVQKDDE